VCAEYLLQNGADVDLCTSTNWSLLHIACELDSLDVKYKSIKLLLDFNANPNHQTDSGITPLMMSSKKGEQDIVQLLLDKDADPHLTTPSNLTAVGMALLEHHHVVVGMLLKKGATLDSRVLYEACRQLQVDLVSQLLRGSLNMNFEHNGWTILGIVYSIFTN
jgi:ankyrin repeat protein